MAGASYLPAARCKGDSEVTLTIAVFTKNRANPAYEGARIGADHVAAAHGARTIHYVPESPDDVEEQRALVARAIKARPDAAVFVPVHETAVNDAVLALNAAGIPLINLIAPTTAGERVTFVGSDDRALAAALAAYLSDALGGTARVVVLEGNPASPTTPQRLAGIREGLARSGTLAIVASLRGDYLRDVAARETARLLASGLEFDAVIAANDSMALGVLDAMAEKQLVRPVVGINAIPEAVAAIGDGRLLATASFDAMKMACIATEAAVRHLRGETVPARITLPVQIVDRSNWTEWNKPYESRALPSWNDVLRPRPPRTD
jgi:ribose transport system substrate-binding protein